MSYKFYDAYLATIATTPFNTYSEGLQAVIDSQYDNTASIYDIEEETALGTLVFSDVKYRTVQAVSSLTGMKLGDDFRRIIYPNTSGSKDLGWRYRFSDNYWLVANSKLFNSVTDSVTLRRCNNLAKFYDSNGVLREEPCVIDYQLNETAPDFSKVTNLPEGTIFMFMQYNENTFVINDNRRFLFGSHGNYSAYKVHGVKNFIADNLVWFTLYRDQVDEVRDDIINGIANAYSVNYTLQIDSDDFEEEVGYTTQLESIVKLNGEIISKDVTWSTSDELIGTIDSVGNIELLDLGSVVFTCTMTDNPDVKDTVTIDSVAVPSPIIDVRFEPNKTTILYGDAPTEYIVTKYLNNVAQVDGFSFVLSGASTSNYKYIGIDDNTFTIESLGFDYTALKVIATSLVDSSVGEIDIQLKNLF